MIMLDPIRGQSPNLSIKVPGQGSFIRGTAKGNGENLNKGGQRRNLDPPHLSSSVLYVLL